ncbi:MAG: hypothetical protein K0B07_02090 [DPANN group archaeon]|nr:hypothetical protein [DPANN group archaeon]
MPSLSTLVILVGWGSSDLCSKRPVLHGCAVDIHAFRAKSNVNYSTKHCAKKYWNYILPGRKRVV